MQIALYNAATNAFVTNLEVGFPYSSGVTEYAYDWAPGSFLYCPGLGATVLYRILLRCGGGGGGRDYYTTDFTLTGLGTAAGQECASTCPAGTFAVCSQADLVLGCYTSCPCSACPAGKASPSSGGVSEDACLPCGAGLFSGGSGASNCLACSAGRFAATSVADEGGGVREPTRSGATMCNSW